MDKLINVKLIKNKRQLDFLKMTVERLKLSSRALGLANSVQWVTLKTSSSYDGLTTRFLDSVPRSYLCSFKLVHYVY